MECLSEFALVALGPSCHSSQRKNAFAGPKLSRWTVPSFPSGWTTWRGLRSLAREGCVEGEQQLAKLLLRFQDAVQRLLRSFADHLKPGHVRRIHVGAVDHVGHSQEAYRRTWGASQAQGP